MSRLPDYLATFPAGELVIRALPSRPFGFNDNWRAMYGGARPVPTFALWIEELRCYHEELSDPTPRSAGALRRVGRWARSQGLESLHGAPPIGRGRPTATRVAEQLPTRRLGDPPDFRFWLHAVTWQLFVAPWGFCNPPGSGDASEPPAVIGDIGAADDDVAWVMFATGDAARRAVAEVELAAWAEADDWELRFLDPLVELVEPTTDVIVHGLHAYCGSCGAVTHTGAIPRSAFRNTGVIRTRCACRGRRHWWSKGPGQALS